jgi:hypothetical protein
MRQSRKLKVRFEPLNPLEVIDTSRKIAKRVHERFPTHGLAQAAADLANHAVRISEDARSLAQRNPLLQFAGIALFLLGFYGAVRILQSVLHLKINWQENNANFLNAMQGIDASIHVIAAGAAILYFFITLDRRARRQLALERLYELRAFAHVVDMHQLDKDPSALAANLPRTISSPERKLSPQELLRYLDYCSEILAMIRKFAALYAQYSRDAIVMETVNDVELLTTTLSSTIWQKIILLQASMNNSSAGGTAASNVLLPPADITDPSASR